MPTIGKKSQYQAATKAVNLITWQLCSLVSKPPNGFLIYSIFHSLFCFPFCKGRALNQDEEKQLSRSSSPSFFSPPCYLCSKSGQVVLIISSAQQTPGCMRFLLASPKLRADIVFKAPLSQRQEQLCCTALPVDVRSLFLPKQMGFLMASVSFSMQEPFSYTVATKERKKNSTGERDVIGRSRSGWFFSK